MPPSYAESGCKRGDEWPANPVGTPFLTVVAGCLIIARQVAEAREVALERQLHRAVGPWRCLPMMTSALPDTAIIFCCHSLNSAVPSEGFRRST